MYTVQFDWYLSLTGATNCAAKVLGMSKWYHIRYDERYALVNTLTYADGYVDTRHHLRNLINTGVQYTA